MANNRKRPLRVGVIGGGIAGLVASLELAARGCEVSIFERSNQVGGKIRQTTLGRDPIDVGPTVLTMKWVFDRIFADVNANLNEHLSLNKCAIIARHAWEDGARLDLFSDVERSIEEIRKQFGEREAAGFRSFSSYASNIYRHAFSTFIVSREPSIRQMARNSGISGLRSFLNIDPFRSVAGSVGRFFKDEHLRQLFCRYATYYGSSPYLAPGTLNLIAAVELQGVWIPLGGMASLVRAILDLTERNGTKIHLNQEVRQLRFDLERVNGLILANGDEVTLDAVIFGGDVSHLASKSFWALPRSAFRKPSPKKRSLSALTIALQGQTSGFPLASHNVFFHNAVYRQEFDDIFRHHRLPRHPTVYVRAQDRDRSGSVPHSERLFMIINAPPFGDRDDLSNEEVESCISAALELLLRSGLTITEFKNTMSVTTPKDFSNQFPSTGGALYGQATHSMWAPLMRSGPKTKVPGLFLAGGSIHPGAGVPMAALSGRQAASAILEEYCSTGLSPLMAMPGGTLTR